MNLIITVAACIATCILSLLAKHGLDSLRRTGAAKEAADILKTAKLEADAKTREAELTAKERLIQIKEKSENELRQTRQELHERERLLDKRQDLLDKQAEDQRKQEKLVEHSQIKLADRIAETEKLKADLSKVIDRERRELHENCGLNREEATEKLLQLLDRELQSETGAVIVKYEKQLKEQCEEISRGIILQAIQRYAAPHTSESTTNSVDIPNDEMKGRIIGREGRNIRAFEKATGIDIQIDDTPGVVIVSGFDPVRREIARLSLVKLISDGRIHPSRIEEVVAQTRSEINKAIDKAGQDALQEADVFNVNPRIVQLLGKLTFRTSFTQNVLRHAIEVAFISGMIAAQIGYDERLARRCGLLHDIGKAIDHETDGTHPKLGAEILKRYGELPEVVHAALGHHDDANIQYPYTVIVAAADACSASRPGARCESMETYIKRMEELEAIANEFNGVEHAFAVQAGRELRVMVNAAEVTDEVAAKTCRDIARNLSARAQFPGEIKVTIIRETRFTEIAK